MAERVRDLLGDAPCSWSSCADLGSGRIDAQAFVPLPVRGEPLGADVLALVSAGPDDAFHGTLDAAIESAEGAPDATWVLWLLGWSAIELPVGELVEQLTGHHHRPYRVVATPYRRLPFAALTVRTTDPVDALDSERIFAHAQAEALAAELEAWRTAAFLAPTPSSGHVERFATERAELSTALREAERRAHAAEQRAARLEASTALKVGQAMVDAVREPRTGLRLPITAYRMWRMRGGRRGRPSPRTTSAPGAASVADPGAVLITGLRPSLAPRTEPVVLGAITATTEQALQPVATVARATQDTIAILADRAEPDLLLIETAVSAPGSPWAYLGSSAAAERELALVEAIDRMQAAGRPVVLWRNTPAHTTAGLDRLAARCDGSVASWPAARCDGLWSPGVGLDGAVGAPARSGAVVVRMGEALPPAGGRRLDALIDRAGDRLRAVRLRSTSGATDGPRGPEPVGSGRSPTREFAAAVVAVADPFDVDPDQCGMPDAVLAALVAGARVLVGSDSDLTAAGFGDAVVVADRGHDIEAFDAALARGPLTDREHLAVLDRVFDAHSPRARLEHLTRLIGRSVGPLADRGVAVVADPDARVGLEGLADDLVTQSHPPSELVLDAEQARRVGVEELRAVGIEVRVVPARLGLLQRAAAAGAPFVTLWRPQRFGPAHLRRLMMGAECAPGALVVGVEGFRSPAWAMPAPSGDALVPTDLLPTIGAEVLRGDAPGSPALVIGTEDLS